MRCIRKAMHLLLEAVHVMLVGCQVQLVLHSKLLRRYEQADALRLGTISSADLLERIPEKTQLTGGL